MPLRLQVISAHRESLGASYIREFAGCGGVIGRKMECDWALPDPKRYLSGNHARIDYQDGLYYLVDLSRNGAFINGSDVPVGQGKPQRLFDGDLVRLGEYEIRCAVIEDTAELHGDSMTDSVVRAQMVREDDSTDETLLDDDNISNEVALEDMITPGDETGQLSALEELTPENAALLRQAANIAVMREAMQVLLQGAGLDPKAFAGKDPQRVLQLAGQLLREFTDSTHTLLRNKDKIVRQLRLSVPAEGRQNPLRSADSLADALRLLLSDSPDAGRSGTAAVAHACREIDNHQRAVIEAMRSALADYLAYFEPEAIEQLARSSGNAAFRDQYLRAFEGLSRPNDKRLPQRFDDEFARAYELETTE